MAASTIAAVNQQQQQQYYPSAGYQPTAAAAAADQHYNHQQASNYYSSHQPASTMAANYAAAAAVAYNQQQSMVPMGHHNQPASTPNGRGSPSTVSSLQYSLDQATKSTKGASKLRRDLINAEIVQLRELLPLPASTRQRLSQLQLMALVLVYVRKSNYFNKAFENFGIPLEPSLMSVSTSGYSKALNGFIMMLTQKGKLLYISDNAAEYLGHSMEDLLSHGDEVYDIIEEQDKKIIRTELLSNSDDARSSPSSKSSVSSLVSQQQTSPPTGETRIALCRMNVSRNARRQMRFGDQKVVLIEGHYSGYLPLTSGPEPVFLANCTPVAMPETRECVVQGSTHVFTSIHSMDMKFLYIDGVGEHHLNCSKQQIHGLSWYELVHPEYLEEAQTKHKRITIDEQERSTIALLRMMTADHSRHIWVHSVMQVKEPAREVAAAKDEDGTSQPVIVCTNQVLSEREAQVMRANAWLYQFYSLHAKMHCPASYTGLGSPGCNADTPDSVCSGQSDSEDLDRCSVHTGDAGDTKSSTQKTLDLTPIKQEAGTTVTVAKKKRPAASSSPAANNSSPPSKRTKTQKAQVAASPISGSLERPQQVGGYPHNQPVKQASAKQASRYSPRSTGSTISSSPPVSAYAGAGKVATAVYGGHHGGALMVDPFSAVHGQQVAAVASHPYHSYANSLGGSNGSSSASSTSSLSSSSSSSSGQGAATTGGASDLSPMAVAAMSAAAGYAAMGSDPIHAAHMHTSHHHHPAMYSAASYTNHSAVDAHHHQAAAASYANQVAMAAHRSAASQHHQNYNPYDHQSTTAQDQAQAYHHHQQHNHHHHHHQSQSHMAPYAHHHHQSHHGQHNAHAAVTAAAFYAPTSYHHAHHQHHQSAAAAYHNHSLSQTGGTAAAAAVAAAAAAATAAAGDIQSSYHSVSAASAAVAAAAAAHAQQGASFHAYNKLAATVNASA